MKEQCVITESGIPVYSYVNPYLHSFCLCLYVKAGAIYESESENGITHFFEHLAIRNIDCAMNGGLYPLLDRLGLSLGGATYKEFVQFSISGAQTHWQEAVELFCRLFDPICLSEREIAIERKRIKAEIRECDNPVTIARKTEVKVWKETSLENRITGKRKALDQIGRPRLEQFRTEFFSKGNLFFYVTGCVDEEQMNLLKERLDRCQFFSGAPLRTNHAPRPEAFFHRNGMPRFYQAKSTEVSFAYDVDTSRYSEAALCLFYNLLFTGDYCPVYQELSEKTGYIYSYDELFERYKNLGSLQLNYEVAPGKLLRAVKRTLEIFERMKTDPGSLAYVRAIYLDNGEMELDDADSFNWNRAYDCHILDVDYPDIEAKKEEFRRVTEEQMSEMAREIFRPENRTVLVRGDLKHLPKKKLRRLLKEGVYAWNSRK